MNFAILWRLLNGLEALFRVNDLPSLLRSTRCSFLTIVADVIRKRDSTCGRTVLKAHDAISPAMKVPENRSMWHCCALRPRTCFAE